MNGINSIIDNIINKIDLNWNDLQKIRYVYLRLGQILEKNTDFFLNDKLGDYKLKDYQMAEIYKDNMLYSRINVKGETQYQIICKSAAFLLKTIFDKINIYSELVYTTAEDVKDGDIRHWFLIVRDNKKKQYFLTLAADLPYIKNEFSTEHFASDLTFFSSKGKPNYVIPDDTDMFLSEVEDEKTGNKGYEFKHDILSERDLKKIDESIGYSQLYQSKNLISSSKFLSLYFEYMESNSDIYYIYRNCFKIGDEELKSSYFIDGKDIENFINKLNEYIFNKIGDKNMIISSLSKEIDTPIYNEDNDLFLFVNDNKKKFKKINDPKMSELVIMLCQVFDLEQRFLELKKVKEELVNFYNNRTNNLYDNVKYNELSIKYKKAINNISISKINSILNRIAFYFIKDEINIINPDDYVSIDYIINKFVIMFPLVFDCSFKNISTVKSNSFSIQNYSEQIVIIKKMLSIIFSELTEKNCFDMEDYNTKYSPVENRIQPFPLKDKQTGEYVIGFRFGTKKEENSPEYIYIPSENVLKARDPIDDRNRYWICSKRFNDLLKEVENMEEELVCKDRIR